ncbi:MAG: hypothetical protein V7K35_03520 [Nostoc sp.]
MSPALFGKFPDACCAASSAFGRGLATATLRDAQGTLSAVSVGISEAVASHRASASGREASLNKRS